MNKKQRKARIKYLKQLQKGPDPKEVSRRKILGVLLPPTDNGGFCLDCLFMVWQPHKPRSTSPLKYRCICPAKPGTPSSKTMDIAALKSVIASWTGKHGCQNYRSK